MRVWSMFCDWYVVENDDDGLHAELKPEREA